MKIITAKLILGLAVIAGLVILISSFKTGDAQKKYTTMVVTKLGMKANVAITIVGENQKTEPVNIASSYSYDDIIKNAQAINDYLNKFTADGYRLVEIVPDSPTVTYYLLEKN